MNNMIIIHKTLTTLYAVTLSVQKNDKYVEIVSNHLTEEKKQEEKFNCWSYTIIFSIDKLGNYVYFMHKLLLTL